jgi:hypothetical protein
MISGYVLLATQPIRKQQIVYVIMKIKGEDNQG